MTDQAQPSPNPAPSRNIRLYRLPSADFLAVLRGQAVIAPGQIPEDAEVTHWFPASYPGHVDPRLGNHRVIIAADSLPPDPPSKSWPIPTPLRTQALHRDHLPPNTAVAIDERAYRERLGIGTVTPEDKPEGTWRDRPSLL